MNYKKITLTILFLTSIALLYFLGIHKYITLQNLRLHANQLKQFVEKNYILSACLYSVFFIGATVATIPVTIVLTIASGFLFGVVLGTALSIFSATAGAVLLFCLVRFLIGEWAQKRYAQQLQRFNDEMRQYGPRYLIALQFLPVTPTALINTLAGVSKISLWNFIWATAVGLLPGTLVYAWIGYHLPNIQNVYDMAMFGLVLALAVIGMVLLAPIILRFFK